ncbi:MAG: hypothetical protein HUJ76_10025, partial [Parasporobacterium sp.]|nr:hypothetical protein [Parasporobacterium sp.]
MRKMKKAIAVVSAAALMLTLAVPAMAQEPAPKTITGVQLSASALLLVDSAQYSQYEMVIFSDGTTQTIDPEAQTFVLVKDGTIVDLDDRANWVPEAELYTV